MLYSSGSLQAYTPPCAILIFQHSMCHHGYLSQFKCRAVVTPDNQTSNTRRMLSLILGIPPGTDANGAFPSNPAHFGDDPKPT